MRVGASQDWPVLLKQPSTPLRTAISRSASSRMMLGDLPPNSWATRLTVSAAVLATMMPARVDPVNDTMSTSLCPAITCPTEGPSPLIML